jgi:hypothetical protein
MAKLVQMRFSGKDRLDALRRVRAHWVDHVQPTGVTWDDFMARCVAVGRGDTIVVVDCELQRAAAAPLRVAG